MSSRSARRTRDRRRHVSSSVEDFDLATPPKLNLRSVKKEPADEGSGDTATAPAENNAEGEMTHDMVGEIWAEFAADHYEIVEQLPLELHRNSRLLRELDQESLSQQEKLQARIRDYVAHRLALATKPMAEAKVEVEEGTPIPGASGIRSQSRATEQPSQGAVPDKERSATRQSSPEVKPDIERTPQVEALPGGASHAAPSKSKSKSRSKSKSKSKSITPIPPNQRLSILSPDSSKTSQTPALAPTDAGKTPEQDVEAADSQDADAVGSPDADAMGSPDPDAMRGLDLDAAGSPDPDAAGSPDPDAAFPVVTSTSAPAPASPPPDDTVLMSRQSSSSEVGAVDDAVAIDDEEGEGTSEAVPHPTSETQGTSQEQQQEPQNERQAEQVSAARDKPNPSSAALGDIARLTRELVRNREEKVAIAIGAYNAIDRHIRALDYALNAQESGLLGISTEPVPAVEEPPAVPGRKDKKRKNESLPVVPPILPPNIEADPNEPRYCYCNNVSYGEMVGCDNEDCPYEWFHLACLGMTAAPVGNWLCDACRPGGSGMKETRDRPKGPKRKRR